MMGNLDRLINELRKLPNETQWVEFKNNNYEPRMIGLVHPKLCPSMAA